MRKILTIISIVVGLVVILGAANTYVAKEKDVQQLTMRFDLKVLKDRANAVQERIWDLEDRYGSYDKMPQTTKEEYRKLKAELDIILKKLTGK